MDLDWRSALLLVTGMPSLAAALWASLQSRERIASRFLAGLVLAWVLLTGPYIIGFSGAYQAYPGLTFFPFNTELWLGPLWLLYIQALTQSTLPKRWWLWLMPGLIQSSYYTICFLFLGDAEQKFAFNDAVHEPFLVPIETLMSLGLIGYAAYASAKRLTVYRNLIEREHGNKDRVDLTGLARAGLAVIALTIIWVSSDIADTLVGGFPYSISFYYYAVSGCIILMVSFDVLSKVDRLYPKLEDFETPPVLPNEALTRRVDIDELRDRVRREGWFLDPDLTLSLLARRLGTNKSTLSAWLNSEEVGNFSSFINGLRVEAVCERLASATEASPNLLQLAFECGFGSKATFNRAFKQEKGLSPRDWLQALNE